MKRRPPLRESRLAQVAVGATMLAVPALVNSHDAAALDQPTTGQSGSQSPVEATVEAHRVPFGRDLVVTGRAPSADVGKTLVLQYAAADSGDWRQLASTTVPANGRFRLAAPVTSSGLVRVAGDSTATPSTTAPVFLASSSSSTTASVPQRVEVEAAIRVPSRAIDALGSKTITVRGRLLPAAGARRVKLQALLGRHWVTLAIARTSPRGRFHLRYRADQPGRERLRVRFAGDRTNAPVARRAGVLTVYHETAASWYDDGGSTACGFHAYYGVANLSLPCGAKVSFAYDGRTVTAVVDDRGPYVGGRTWDLNQNSAQALGVVGVQTVWSSS
jgi:peptidoglycan lytic transglycosylase